MKKITLYLAVLLGVLGLASCNNNWEYPPLTMPSAGIEANTTIAELKAAFYDGTTNNYATLVGTKDDGTNYIIEGRVVTSDQSGNLFKQVVIADETSAIQLNVDAYDLYTSYQVGQKVVVNVTGLYVGAYGKLMQIGAAPTSGYPSRISSDDAAKHLLVDGLADPSTVEPYEVTVAELNDIAKNTTEWLDWQCRLVKIDGLTFKDAGRSTLSTSGSNGVSQTLVAEDGATIILYTSGYSDFYDYYCPTGKGSVTAMLSWYGSNWQLRLISIDGLEGFDELSKEPDPSVVPAVSGDGTEAKPYSCADVIAGATGSAAWVKGYIVGWVDGMTLADGARFNASATVASNILIADDPNCTDVAKCVPVQLPTGEIRNAVNLQNNPGNFGKEVALKGSLEKYFGTAGLKSVTATNLIDGSTPDTPDTPTGTATFKRVDKVTSGKQYVIIADGKLAKPLDATQTYGYLKTADVTVGTDGTVSADVANAFTLTADGSDWNLVDAAGRYYYQTGTYNSFNVDTTKPSTGAVWAITFASDKATITNTSVKKSIQYDSQYGSYGSYDTVKGSVPALYEKVD